MHSYRKQLLFVLGAWLFFCMWVVIVVGIFGYRQGAGSPESLLFGFPGWVVWGVFVPWLVADAVTVVFALWIIRDGDEEDSGEDEACR